MKQFSFCVDNKIAKNGVFSSLEKLYPVHCPPVIVCIGTDSVSGDSLGPLVGTMLKERKVSAYIYGNLCKPITAREAPFLNDFLRGSHPDSKVIVIDSAIGHENEVGVVKVFNDGIKPGLGANKNLPKVGDISIIGIVSPKSIRQLERLKRTRLRLIYSLATLIADALEEFISYTWATRSAKRSFIGISKIKQEPNSFAN